MTPRVQISVYDDFDSRHYQFERNTRLPRHAFDQPRVSVDMAMWLTTAVCAVLLLAAWALL